MNKITRIIATTSTILTLAAGAAFAAPVEKTDSFVCPVLGDQVGVHGKAEVFKTPPGGFTTIIGPNISVPIRATNDDGAGSPAGPFASPGDDGYTAIWEHPTQE